MKAQLLRALQFILKLLSRATIWRYRPGVIGITGSVGKTSAKLAIGAVLASDRSVRVARGNFNGEIGLPITILGEWREEEVGLLSREHPPGKNIIKKVLFLSKVIFTSIVRLIRKTDYPEILVLEYGIDRPGDMKRLIEIARPDIGVITAIGDIPAHVEYFETPKDVAREKSRIIECLPPTSFAVLNYDNDIVMNLRERARSRVVTFGFGAGANVHVTGFAHVTDGDRPTGIAFKVNYAGRSVPLELEGVLGKAHAYAAAAGVSIGIIFGLPLQKIADALKTYQPASGRMEVLAGKNETYLLNDAYNASPLSMESALETLADLPGKRKVAVLGDMLEIGKYAPQAHEQVGIKTAKTVDLLLTVGPHAKLIAEGAQRAGMKKNLIVSFGAVEDALSFIPDLLKKGDLVLVKGSHAVGLEKLVEALKEQVIEVVSQKREY